MKWNLGKITAILLLICLLIQFSPSSAESLFSGRGTADAPYLIRSVDDLVLFRDSVNNGNSFEGVYFLQTKNLDLSEIEWIPIGLYASGNYFCGVYDGGGYAIRNLRITQDKYYNPGFFGMLGGTVMNLAIIDAQIISTSCAAVIASQGGGTGDSMVLNCYSNSSVQGFRAGGIVDNFRGKVYNCVSVSTLDATRFSGGISSYGATWMEHCFATQDSMKNTQVLQDTNMAATLSLDSINTEALAKELNQWCRTYAEGHEELERELVLWAVKDGALSLTQETYTVPHEDGASTKFLNKAFDDRNELMILLAFIIGAIGIIYLYTDFIAGRQGKRAVLLFVAGLAGVILMGLYTLVIPMSNGTATGGLIERTLFFVELFVLFYLTHALVRGKDRLTDLGRIDGTRATGTWIFLTGYLLMQFFAFVALIAYQGNGTASIFYQDRSDSFMDLFHSLCTARNPKGYLDGAIYPPLYYAVYLFLGLFIPNSFYAGSDAAKLIRSSQEGMGVLILFLMLGIMMVFGAVYNAKKGKAGHRALFAVCLLFSSPFLFALERGNLMIYALACMLFFVFFYRSEKPVIRELALLALAAATAMELTPAVLFLLLLLDKEYKMLLRGGVYTLLLLLLPFAVYGGFGQIPAFVSNLLGPSTGEYTANRIAEVNSVAFGSVLSYFGQIITPAASSASVFKVLGWLTTLLLLGCAVLNKGWKRILALVLLICGWTHSNCPYVMVYMFIPLIAFLDDHSPRTHQDATALFLFIAMFAIYPISQFGALGELTFWKYNASEAMTLTCFVEGAALLIMAWTQIVSTGINVYKNRKAGKQHGKDTIIEAAEQHEYTGSGENAGECGDTAGN